MTQAATMDSPAPEKAGDPYLSISEAHAAIKAMGFKDVSRRQVERWAYEGKLPFFRWGRHLYIQQSELRAWFKRLQLAAVKRLNR